MATIQTPQITTAVNQNFFIEALQGSQPVVNYLDRFPDTVYSKHLDSLLVQFMYALLGPVGVGQLKQEFLEARLEIEEAGLRTVNLDACYTNAFAFARLAAETYQLDADSSLLPAAQRAQIISQDANFRNRAQLFLKGARAGGTALGLSLAAESGLNRPVEIIENYQQLFDRWSDVPLSLPIFGSSTQYNEVIAVPRDIQLEQEVQTLQITGSPVRGFFTLTYPANQPWQIMVVTASAGSSVLQVPDVNKFPPGCFVTITPVAAVSGQSLATFINGGALYNPQTTLYAYSGGPGVPSGTGLPWPPANTPLINLVNAAGAPTTALASGTFLAIVGNAQTAPIPYNATAGQVQNALMGLPVIGPGNVQCTGGPLPDQPIQVTFIGQLSGSTTANNFDQPVQTLLANVSFDYVTGIRPTGSGGNEQMSDVNGSPLNIALAPQVTLVPVVGAGQTMTIAPDDMHDMFLAMDQIRPWTTMITTQQGASTMVQQPISSTFTGQSTIEVLRYVTGRSTVPWPAVDTKHWIQGGIEHEAPTTLTTGTQQYTSFHNIVTIQSYNEQALLDVYYETGTANPPLSTTYWNSLVGSFSGDQLTLCPGLSQLLATQTQFRPVNAPAPTPDPLVITTDTGSGVINRIYPVDYLSLPGVNQPNSNQAWASSERIGGTDYLEIDLGQAQAVNYITFQASHKPFVIDVAFDTLDQTPTRHFVKAKMLAATNGLSTIELTYDTNQLWQHVELAFTDMLGQMIFTRFIRIGFTRQPANTPFTLPIPSSTPQPSQTTASLPLLGGVGTYVPPATPLQYKVIPYSVEVQNLRVGRNVAS